MRGDHWHTETQNQSFFITADTKSSKGKVMYSFFSLVQVVGSVPYGFHKNNSLYIIYMKNVFSSFNSNNRYKTKNYPIKDKLLT